MRSVALGCVSFALACGSNASLTDNPDHDAQDPVERDVRGASGVTAQRAAAQLSNADTLMFCSWASGTFSKLYDQSAERTCTFFVTALGGEGAECTTSVKSCMADAADTERDTTAQDASCMEDLQGCSASVAELEACIEEQASKIRGALERASCSRPLTEAERTDYGTLASKCQIVAEQCPQIFGGSSADDGSDRPSENEADWFKCNPGEQVVESVQQTDRCDGVVDCSNGADEQDCN